MFGYTHYLRPLFLVCSLLFAVWTVPALDLETLRQDAHLTPETFANYFRDFHFELNEDVQQPDVFLARERGDCDDYATLAADLLREKGYTTRLFVVFMPKNTHVVCYVEESKGYLDFNNRKMPKQVVECAGTIEEVANKVSASFRAKWHCASEFTFKNGVRHFVCTDFPQAPQDSKAPDLARPWGQAPKR